MVFHVKPTLREEHVAGFGARAFEAWNRLKSMAGKPVTLQDLGRMVGNELRTKPYHGQTVGKWFRPEDPKIPRDPMVLSALATVLCVDPGWLAYGELSVAPVPEYGGAVFEEVRKLTIERLDAEPTTPTVEEETVEQLLDQTERDQRRRPA